MMKPESMTSVVTPVHNGSHFIEKAIETVYRQKLPFEMIIIDDGSTDHIDEVMEKYSDRPEIIYVKNTENLGVAKTRNKGVKMAKGDYIAFLDCDDWWEDNKLSKQYAMIEKTGAVLCATGRRLMTPEGEWTDRTIGVKEVLTYKDLLRQNPINCSSVLIKREVAQEFPMEHDDCHEDYIMWLRVLQKYHKACAVNEPLLCYRLSNSGKSGNKLKSAKMTYMVYRYMGFGTLKSLFCFIAYAFNGVKKYYLKK